MKAKIIQIVCAAAVGTAALTPAQAKAHTDSTGVAMDAVVGRPLGLVATVLGSAIFVVSLPFSATSGSIKPAAEALVVRPPKDTFSRPIGDLHSVKNPAKGHMTRKPRQQKKAQS
jgi:hypothetical protein